MICTQVTQISHSTVGSSFSVSFSADTSELDLLNMMHKWFREWNMSGIGFAKIEPQNMASYIIEAYSRGYTDGADAAKAIKDEPQIVVDWKDEMWAEAREQLEKCLTDKTEPTISKMEQVDKDINVRSKDEPQTETQIETQNSNLTFEKRTMRDCYNCKRYESEEECVECNFEPKDEPQTERSEVIELHGRLIDADAMKESMKNTENNPELAEVITRWIDARPTVIEGSE